MEKKHVPLMRYIDDKTIPAIELCRLALIADANKWEIKNIKTTTKYPCWEVELKGKE